MAELIYAFHWVFLGSALVLSWNRSRNIFHPHFLFTVMLCIPFVDFMVRGYKDRNLKYISEADIFWYQFIILITIGATCFLTALVRNRSMERMSRNVRVEAGLGSQATKLLIIIGIIVLAELVKRLISVNWSLAEVIHQTLTMPRGHRDWDVAQFSGNFVFAIIAILFPLAGLLSAILMNVGGQLTRLLGGAFLVFVSSILITNGSRTPVVVVLACAGLFWYLRQKTFWKRALIVGVTAAVIAVSTSFMYLTRSYGATSDAAPEFNLTYHLDDSYYRSIRAFAHADESAEYWDPFYFFFTVAANPIPRAFWPEKPVLTAEFFGGYKLSYVTTTFLGEIVAMTGVVLIVPLGVICGVLLYLLLFNAQELLRRQLGLLAYLVVALYVYMCLRSLQNVTLFIYFPTAAILVVRFLGQRKRRQFPRVV